MLQTFKREISPGGSSPAYSPYPSPASTSLTSPCTSPKQVNSALPQHDNYHKSDFLPPVSTAANQNVYYGVPNSPYSHITSFSQSPGSPYHSSNGPYSPGSPYYSSNGPYSPGLPGGFSSEYPSYVAPPLSPAYTPIHQTFYNGIPHAPPPQMMEDDDDGDGVWYTRDGREVRYSGMHLDCATM